MSNKNSRYKIEVFKYLISVLILGSAIGVTTLLIRSKEAPPNKGRTSFIPAVRLYNTQLYHDKIDLIVSGTVVPFREIKVSAEVTGQIASKKDVCQAGNYVEEGTILFEIDQEDFKLEIKRIKAEVEQSEKMLAETVEDLRAANETLVLAREEFELEESQFQRRQDLRNAISKSEFDTARQAYLAAQSQLTARVNSVRALETRQLRMQSAIAVAKTQEAKANLDLRRTTVRAPATGVIVAERVEEGEIVSRGTEMVLFEDTSKSEVKCNLTQSELNWIRDNSPRKTEVTQEDMQTIYHLPSTKVTVYDQSNPQVKWHGILERFDGIGLDNKTKTIPCRIEIANPITLDENERPVAIVREMFVKCKIEIEVDEMAGDGTQFMVFPASAVQPGDYVWKVRTEPYVKKAEDKTADKDKDKKGKGLWSYFASMAYEPPDFRYYLVKQPVAIVDYTSIDDKKMIVVKVGKGGLNLNEHIVTTPIAQPSDGSEVTIYEKSQAPTFTSDDTTSEKLTVSEKQSRRESPAQTESENN